MKLSATRAALVVLAFVFAGMSQAADKQAEVFPTLVAGTNSYSNALILRTTETEAYVRFDGGIVRVKLADLPLELQEKYPPTTEKNPTRVPPPVVYQRVPIELAIRNLETQITALENSRKQLQTELSGSQPVDLSSEADRNKLAEANRRAEHVDRLLAQMQLQLNRLRVARDRNVARGTNLGGETNPNGGAGSTAGATVTTGLNGNEQTATSASPNPQRPPLPQMPNRIAQPGNMRAIPYRR